MEPRRLTGLIALIVLAGVIGGLIYYDNRPRPPTTAFAPAESTDEQVAVPDATAIAPVPDVAAMAPEAAKIADAAPESVVTGDAAPAGTSKAETDVALAGPDAPATETAAGPPAADATIPPNAAPSFDVVRVEPSGDTVIAGQAEPKSTVEILDGAAPIATTEANERGEWAVVLETPLGPGAHDLALRTTSPDKTIASLSDQRVTVSVPEAGSTDVLVVLNTPNAASKVLQISPPVEPAVAANEPAAGTQAETAAAKEVATAEEAPAPTAPASGQAEIASTEQLATTPSEPGAVPAAEQQVALAPSVDEPTSNASGRETQAPDVAAVSGDAADVTKPAETPGLEKQTAAIDQPTKEAAPTATEAPAANDAEMAATAPGAADAGTPGEPPAPASAPAQAVAPAPPPPPKPEVVVAAVEAETTGRLYIAGTATTPETVRVYLDDAVIGDAKPSPSGTWLIETQKDLPAGTYTVRADQLGGDGAVLARSEVPFERDVEVAVLKPTGMTASAEGASLSGVMPAMETVIIKRGDNLWRIARGAWGKGLRWSTIYQANTDQIRNPDRIYPGQVFLMPKGDARWLSESETTVQN